MCRILNVITKKKWFLIPRKGDRKFRRATAEGKLGRGRGFVLMKT